MNLTYRIVIYGHSLFLAAIEANLTRQTELEVIRFQPHLPTVADRIIDLQPDIIIVQHGSDYGHLAQILLPQGLLFVALDEMNQQAIVLSGQPVPLVGLADLNQLVKQIKPV